MAQKNPKLREKLKARHEAHLAHREERETKEREDFTRTPTPRQAKHEARAATNVEYSPTIRGIRGELASSRAKQKQENQWYNQLGSEQAQAAQQAEGAAGQLSTSLTAQLANANSQNEAFLTKQNAANQQMAAQTGVPMQPGTGAPAAAGAAVGAQQAVSLNAPTQAAAYAQGTLLRRQGLATRETGHQVAGEQFGVRKKVRQDLQAAQKQKGQAYVGRLAEERESARKQELDAKAFELEGQQTALGAQQEAAKLRQNEIQSRRSAQTSRQNSAASTAASEEGNAISAQNAETDRQKAQREQREYAEERRYKRSHGGRTPSEVKSAQPSTSEKAARRENLKNGYAAAKQAIKALGKRPTSYTAAEWLALEQHLTAPDTGNEPGAGVKPAVAAKIVKILKRQAKESVPAQKVQEIVSGF